MALATESPSLDRCGALTLAEGFTLFGSSDSLENEGQRSHFIYLFIFEIWKLEFREAR